MQGVAKSPAAGAAGMMLATSGLFGSQRGTWTGSLEDTAGGALIGEQIGGQWGAAIGAAAGFTAGMTEKLLGIDSPPRKAHDDIKSIYGADIPQNSGTIKQVVQIGASGKWLMASSSRVGQHVAACPKQSWYQHLQSVARLFDYQPRCAARGVRLAGIKKVPVALRSR